jgi:hypothetical protein
MKAIFKATLTIAVICAICAITGCIQAEPTLILKEDGSGTFDLEYSISEQSITQFRAMMRLRDELMAASGKPAAPPDDPLIMLFYNPAEKAFTTFFSKYKANGIRIAKISVDTRNASKKTHIRLDFESLSQIAQTDLFTNHRISLQKNKAGDYILKRDKTDKDSSNKTLSQQEHEGLTPLLGGFNVTVRVNTPGMILRSNAAKTSRFTAQWTFNYNKNPHAITDLHDSLMQLTFAGKNIEL